MYRARPGATEHTKQPLSYKIKHAAADKYGYRRLGAPLHTINLIAVQTQLGALQHTHAHHTRKT